jgi:hypothetical protein
LPALPLNQIDRAQRWLRAGPMHHFVVHLDHVDVLDGKTFDRLVRAGCDDALFGERGDKPYAEFQRRARTLDEAERTASEDIKRAAPWARIVRIDDDPSAGTSVAGRARLGVTAGAHVVERLLHAGRETRPGDVVGAVQAVAMSGLSRATRAVTDRDVPVQLAVLKPGERRRVTH